MSIGARKRLVRIERKAAGQDSIGQPSVSWETVATVWADVRTQTGLEAIKADADVSTVRASVRIRARTDVDASMQVVVGAERYDIKAVLPDEARRGNIDLICESVK